MRRENKISNSLSEKAIRTLRGKKTVYIGSFPVFVKRETTCLINICWKYNWAPSYPFLPFANCIFHLGVELTLLVFRLLVSRVSQCPGHLSTFLPTYPSYIFLLSLLDTTPFCNYKCLLSVTSKASQHWESFFKDFTLLKNLCHWQAVPLWSFFLCHLLILPLFKGCSD